MSDVNKKVDDFAAKFGDGSVGLTEEQKSNRVEKFVGKKPKKFFELKHNKDPNHVGPVDVLEGVKDFSEYETDVRDSSGKHKLLSVKVNSDGSMEFNGVVLDGNENDVALRSTYSGSICSDEEEAKFEAELFNQGKAFECMDRAKVIHKKNGKLDSILSDSKIDSSDDGIGEY
jgi:hypothetical protein